MSFQEFVARRLGFLPRHEATALAWGRSGVYEVTTPPDRGLVPIDLGSSMDVGDRLAGHPRQYCWYLQSDQPVWVRFRDIPSFLDPTGSLRRWLEAAIGSQMARPLPCGQVHPTQPPLA